MTTNDVLDDKTEKGLRIELRMPCVYTEGAGPALVGPFTVGAMQKLQPLVEKPDLSDEDFARMLFREVARAPAKKPDGAEVTLTDAEITALSRSDLERLARTFIANRGNGKPSDQADPLAAVRNRVRREIALLHEQAVHLQQMITDRFKPLAAMFSDNTRKLFEESAGLSASLREQLKGLQINSGAAEAMQALHRNVGVPKFNLPQIDTTSSTRTIPDLSPRIRPGDQAAIDLNEKASQAMLVISKIAAMLTTTNEGVLSAVADLAQKRIDDRRHAWVTVGIALAALITSAFLAGWSLWQDRTNYASGDEQQKRIEALIVDQNAIARSQSDLLREQGELLRAQGDLIREQNNILRKNRLAESKAKPATPSSGGSAAGSR